MRFDATLSKYMPPLLLYSLFVAVLAMVVLAVVHSAHFENCDVT